MALFLFVIDGFKSRLIPEHLIRGCMGFCTLCGLHSDDYTMKKKMSNLSILGRHLAEQSVLIFVLDFTLINFLCLPIEYVY